MLDASSLEPRPGTYALVCPSCREGGIPVGRIGVLAIRKGVYVYVGSALGPGGIRARVGRHLHRALHPHWHVDYLWPTLRVGEIWFTYDPVRREHEWVHALRRVLKHSVPLRGFGSSDCRCEAHLLFFEHLPSIGAFRAALRTRGRSPIRRVVTGTGGSGESGGMMYQDRARRVIPCVRIDSALNFHDWLSLGTRP